MSKPKNDQWTMPEWMEPYRSVLDAREQIAAVIARYESAPGEYPEDDHYAAANCIQAIREIINASAPEPASEQRDRGCGVCGGPRNFDINGVVQVQCYNCYDHAAHYTKAAFEDVLRQIVDVVEQAWRGGSECDLISPVLVKIPNYLKSPRPRPQQVKPPEEGRSDGR